MKTDEQYIFLLHYLHMYLSLSKFKYTCVHILNSGVLETNN